MLLMFVLLFFVVYCAGCVVRVGCIAGVYVVVYVVVRVIVFIIVVVVVHDNFVVVDVNCNVVCAFDCDVFIMFVFVVLLRLFV